MGTPVGLAGDGPVVLGHLVVNRDLEVEKTGRSTSLKNYAAPRCSRVLAEVGGVVDERGET